MIINFIHHHDVLSAGAVLVTDINSAVRLFYPYGPKPCYIYRGADKSLARPTSRGILFDGENISFDASLVIYTECPRRNVPGFGRVFLTLKNTDITQNTYVQS